MSFLAVIQHVPAHRDPIQNREMPNRWVARVVDQKRCEIWLHAEFKDRQEAVDYVRTVAHQHGLTRQLKFAPTE